MMSLQEEYILAQELYGECANGDYKDMAESTYCACSQYVGTGKASQAFMDWFNDAPDGVSCPRSWMNYGF